MTSRLLHLRLKIQSFFHDQTVETFYSKKNLCLTVAYSNGQLVLNSRDANYSFGNLTKVFIEVFRRLEPEISGIRSALVLGAGAGDVIGILRSRYMQDGPITAVEHDPVVLRIGRKYFNLGKWKNIELIESDAFEFIASNKSTYDLVVMDIFEGLDVPPVFLNSEFYHLLCRAVEPGGMLVFNLMPHNSYYVEKHSELVGFMTSQPSLVLQIPHSAGNEMVVWKKMK